MLKRNPLDNMRITSPFGARIHPTTREPDFHNGVDVPAREGTPVFAPLEGRIVVSTYHEILGNYIVLEHDGICTLYCHLYKRYFRTQTQIKAGQIIGEVGSTGRSSGSHLHFEIHQGKYTGSRFWIQRNGKYPGSVDPEPYLLKEGEDDVEERELKIEIDGKIVTVRAVMHKDLNYVNFRDLVTALGRKPDYDPARKMPVVK